MRISILGLFSALCLAACDQPNHCDRPQGSMPYVMSQSIVERLLRAPSTAKFPSFTDPQVTSNLASKTETGCIFLVDGYVDAQNGFGAMVRSRFYVEIEYHNQDQTWRALDARLF